MFEVRFGIYYSFACIKNFLNVKIRPPTNYRGSSIPNPKKENKFVMYWQENRLIAYIRLTL